MTRKDLHSKLMSVVVKKFNTDSLYIFIVALFLCSGSSAQGVKKGRSSFAGANRIIFEDALMQEKAGTFPKKWDTIRSWNPKLRETFYYDKKKWHMVKEDSASALESNTTYLNITPIGLGRTYLPDSFDLDVDFVVSVPGAWMQVYFHSNGDSCIATRFFNFGSDGKYITCSTRMIR